MKVVDHRYLKTRITLFHKKICAFMRSKISRELMIFLFFCFLSFIFWMLLSLNDTSETGFRIPMQYRVPDKMVVTSPLPQHLDIRLRDKGTVLLNYWAQGFSPLEVDLKQYENKSGISEITPRQLQQQIRKQLQTSTSLMAMTPDTIPLYYTLSAGKKLPVEVRSRITTAIQCVADSTIGLSPDSVMVYAPQQILDKINTVYTDSLIAREQADTLRTELSLLPVAGAKIVPDRVSVTLYVEEVTLKQFDIPITVVGLPGQYSVITFPANVQLSCMVALSDFATLKPDDFQVNIDFEQILRNNGKKQPVTLSKAPAKAMNIQIAPDSVEYIIEERLP